MIDFGVPIKMLDFVCNNINGGLVLFNCIESTHNNIRSDER